MSYLIIGVMLLTGGTLLFILYNIVRAWCCRPEKNT
jgi:hypothetical protein